MPRLAFVAFFADFFPVDCFEEEEEEEEDRFAFALSAGSAEKLDVLAAFDVLEASVLAGSAVLLVGSVVLVLEEFDVLAGSAELLVGSVVLVGATDGSVDVILPLLLVSSVAACPPACKTHAARIAMRNPLLNIDSCNLTRLRAMRNTHSWTVRRHGTHVFYIFEASSLSHALSKPATNHRFGHTLLAYQKFKLFAVPTSADYWKIVHVS